MHWILNMVKKTVLSLAIGLVIASSYSYSSQTFQPISRALASQVMQTIQRHPIASVAAVSALASIADNYCHQNYTSQAKSYADIQQDQSQEDNNSKETVLLFVHGLREKQNKSDKEIIDGLYGHLTRMVAYQIEERSAYHFHIPTKDANQYADQGSTSTQYANGFTQIIKEYHDNRINPTVKNYPAINNLNTYAFVFPDALNGEKASDLGQIQDSSVVKKTIEQLKEDYNIILYCQSRGGAAAINCLGKNKDLQGSIKGIIVESSFHNPHAAIYKKIATKLKIPVLVTYCLPRFLINIAVKKIIFPLFNPQANTPIHNIHAIDPNIPMLFLATKGDLTVPWESTKKLHDARVAMSPSNTYWYLDDTATHCHMVTSQGYQKEVKDFLAKIKKPDLLVEEQ